MLHIFSYVNYIMCNEEKLFLAIIMPSLLSDRLTGYRILGLQVFFSQHFQDIYTGYSFIASQLQIHPSLPYFVTAELNSVDYISPLPEGSVLGSAKRGHQRDTTRLKEEEGKKDFFSPFSLLVPNLLSAEPKRKQSKTKQNRTHQWASYSYGNHALPSKV